MYGWCGLSNIVSTSARSTTLPAYITTTSSAISATTPEVVGDEHDRHLVLLAERLHELQDLRLDRDVERGRGLVGDEQLGVGRQRHRDHHALAHAARQLVRIGASPAASRRRCRPGRASRWPGPRPPSWRPSCGAAPPRRSGRRTVKTGFSDVIGSWKIIEIAVAADVAHLLVGELEQVAAVEQDLAGDGASRPLDEAHHRQRGDALAAARFADHAERLAVPDLEADAVDGLDRAVLGEEVRLEALDLERFSDAAGLARSVQGRLIGSSPGSPSRIGWSGRRCARRRRVNLRLAGAGRGRRAGRRRGSSRRAR